MSRKERDRMKIMAGVKAKELTQVQAAELMGVGYRQTKRVWRRYRDHRLRARLANGNFPEKLEAMTPQFISPFPHDVINGEPFHYRRGEGNQFTLYSVGWNLRGHDQSARKSLFDGKEGDWVWEYPQKASNPKAKPLK